MTRRWTAALQAALVILATLQAGCGRRVELVPVEGRVVFDGRPLSSGSIMLRPEAGPAARGRLDADGRFRMGTYGPGDGVIPGPAAVRVVSHVVDSAAAQNPDEEPSLSASRIPERYSDFQSSDLTVEVVRGMGPVTIELWSR